jgi:hypothetical protein
LLSEPGISGCIVLGGVWEVPQFEWGNSRCCFESEHHIHICLVSWGLQSGVFLLSTKTQQQSPIVLILVTVLGLAGVSFRLAQNWSKRSSFSKSKIEASRWMSLWTCQKKFSRPLVGWDGVWQTQEFLVLGSQPLTALRDRLYCLTDELAQEAKLNVPSGYFLIEVISCALTFSFYSLCYTLLSECWAVG